MTADPPPGPDGEGAYPQSSERLGAQRGWHSTVMLVDPNRNSTTPRDVTLQVACTPKFGNVTPMRQTKYVRPGESKKVVARCPGRRHLFAGGFQRTDLSTIGGSYATESWATSAKTWRVAARAFGAYGGDVTAIAYCRPSKRPLMTAVSSSALIGTGSLGSATTPGCPPGRVMTSGGFAGPRSGPIKLASGLVTPAGSWTTAGYNSGSPTRFSAYGYCLRGALSG